MRKWVMNASKFLTNGFSLDLYVLNPIMFYVILSTLQFYIVVYMVLGFVFMITQDCFLVLFVSKF